MKKQNPPPAPQILLELEEASREMRYAWKRFDMYTDPALIEASIFEINAASARYSQLLHQAKRLNLCGGAAFRAIHSKNGKEL